MQQGCKVCANGDTWAKGVWRVMEVARGVQGVCNGHGVEYWDVFGV